MAKSSAAGLLTSVDSMFTTQEERDNAQRSYVTDLPTAEISDFPNHPFKVRMDESMTEMVSSVKERGVLSPVLVRPMLDGGYQMVSGHRRKMAAELAELPTVPCIVRELTDDEAVIIMVDSNLQREQVLPSEKAFAYKMKLDAMKRQGQRSDLTLSPVATKLDSAAILGKQSGESRDQVFRYIRLTNLIPEILDMVDNSVLKEKDMIASVKALVAAIAAGGWVAILAIVIICLIGLIVGSCFGIFFSGEDSGSGQTMPTVVREINQEYEGKLDEIKNGTAHDTLEMSGSRAVWPEVLAIYAVKTTTDPDNPQEVATMDDSKKELLKEIFWAMNEISSRTETATTTQTVETDDGAGNIIEEEVEATTTTLYITVTHKTADEMADAYNFTADQRAQLAELLAEENRSMWSSALYGIGVGDGEIVVVALSQLGNVGGQPYWSWYGFNSRVEWCACFVSWCANECGYLDAGVIPRTAGCISGSNWFKDRGLWQDNSYEPRPGDIIYFDWDNKGSSGPQDGLADHVGIVEKVENGMVYTVEGNSGDSCRENRYAIGHYEIYGYGTPAY